MIERKICGRSKTVLLAVTLAALVAASPSARAQDAKAPANTSADANDPVAKELEMMRQQFLTMKEGMEAMQARMQQLEAELKDKKEKEANAAPDGSDQPSPLLATTTKDPGQIPISPGTFDKADPTKTVATTAGPAKFFSSANQRRGAGSESGARSSGGGSANSLRGLRLGLAQRQFAPARLSARWQIL